MSPIGQIDTVIKVTPGDDPQLVRGPGDHEFLSDRTPFDVKVAGIIQDAGKNVGVFGQVISGPDRYRNLVATLPIRSDGCDWSKDNRSSANFKVGAKPARLCPQFPLWHPEGTIMEGFPYIVRFGSIDARSGDEATVNTALEQFPKPKDHHLDDASHSQTQRHSITTPHP